MSMKEEIGSTETNVPSKPSTRRRASHNMGDAGREINAYAFQLHKSSQASPPEQEHTLKGTNSNPNNCEIDVSMFADVKCCCYLLEAMPLPGPTWSTAGPSVLAEPPSTPPPLEAAASVGLEWGENQASSYTWWLGFLEGLDGNMSTTEKLDLPHKNIVMEHSKGHSHEPKFVDAIELGCCPDDWLMIPTMEKDLGDIVVP